MLLVSLPCDDTSDHEGGNLYGIIPYGNMSCL